MTAVSNSLVVTRNPQLHPSSGHSWKRFHKCLENAAPTIAAFGLYHPRKLQLSYSTTHCRQFSVQASYRDNEALSGGSIFVGGFVLGGLLIGALSCVYAPQISRALAETNETRKDLLRRLPKFVYDEEKARLRKVRAMTEKFAKLNSAIDDFSLLLIEEDLPKQQ